MTSFRIRPRFQMIATDSPPTLESRLKERLAQPGSPCMGRVIPGHAVLKIPVAERHFWSPQLDLSLEPHESGTLIRGLYGPDPSIWVLFAFGYGAIATLSLFISIFGFTRLSLGLEAPILWALLALGVCALGLYIASQIGQKLGAEQTFTIHHFFEETVGNRVHIV